MVGTGHFLTCEPVEFVADPLGESPAVGEYDRRTVAANMVEQGGIDGRPDR